MFFSLKKWPKNFKYFKVPSLLFPEVNYELPTDVPIEGIIKWYFYFPYKFMVSLNL